MGRAPVALLAVNTSCGGGMCRTQQWVEGAEEDPLCIPESLLTSAPHCCSPEIARRPKGRDPRPPPLAPPPPLAASPDLHSHPRKTAEQQAPPTAAGSTQ